MDSSNLAIIFAPTVFRSDMIDPMKAVMEMKLSKMILKELIDRLSILQQAMHMFSDRHRREKGLNNNSSMFIFENEVEDFDESLLNGELASKINISEVRTITDNFGGRFASRMKNRKNRQEEDGEDEESDRFDPRISNAGLAFLPPTPGELDLNNPDFAPKEVAQKQRSLPRTPSDIEAKEPEFAPDEVARKQRILPRTPSEVDVNDPDFEPDDGVVRKQRG